MKKIIQSIFKYSKFENASECLRIYLGIALLIKSLHFITHPQDLGYFLTQGQLNVIETIVTHYVISAHLFGGLLLTLGLLTNLAALVQIPVLIGALTLVHANEKLFSVSQNIELTGLVLFLLIIFSIVGSGHLSVDYYLFGEATIKKETWLRKLLKNLLPKDLLQRQTSTHFSRKRYTHSKKHSNKSPNKQHKNTSTPKPKHH